MDTKKLENRIPPTAEDRGFPARRFSWGVCGFIGTEAPGEEEPPTQ